MIIIITSQCNKYEIGIKSNQIEYFHNFFSCFNIVKKREKSKKKSNQIIFSEIEGTLSNVRNHFKKNNKNSSKE